MGLAREMWDYLKSIGFKDIPNDDERLGVRAGGWKNTIKYGDLCAYNDIMDNFVGFVDITKKFSQNNMDLNIYSVADLEAWLRKEYPEFFTAEKPTTNQHQYKVGDKVRILEDAHCKGGSVVDCYKVKSAVGKLGVVSYDTQYWEGIRVSELPSECDTHSRGWYYEPHQIEPYIEEKSGVACTNESITDDINFIQKYFMNDDHREMHDVLLSLGYVFSRPNRGKTPEADFCYSNNINKDTPSRISFSFGGDTVCFQFSSLEGHKELSGKSFKEVTAYFIKQEQLLKQHQYKLGDKVRILEDAIVYEGADVVQEYGAQTAVGEIGVVNDLRGDGYIEVKDLPTECGSCWSYSPHQIEPYIEEAPIQTTTLGGAQLGEAMQITETDTQTDKRKEALIEEVVSNFDWVKVHNVMTHLNWEWFMGDAFEVPTIGYMICSVQRSLSQVYDKAVINGSLCENTSSGGFTAEAFLQDGEVHLKLCFNVAEWDTAL